MSRVTVVVGPPCAGKSTFVRNSAAAGDVIVDYDAIAKAFGGDDHRPGGAVRDVAFAARSAAIDAIIAGVEADAWIIHTAPTAEQVVKYQNVGATFELLDPGIETCIERAESGSRPAGTEDTIRAWYASPPAVSASSKSTARRETPPMFRTKISPLLDVKAGPEDGLAEGEFIVYPSTFIRRADSYGDVVKQGAFADWIARFKSSGLVLPGLFGHRMDDPDFYVAGATDMGEDDHGFWVRGMFDLESPKGPQVYRLVKGRRLNQLSFAYETFEEGLVTLEDGTKANELRKLGVHEFSFVPLGANQDTGVLAIKQAVDLLTKEGRVLAQKHIDSLRAAQDAIGVVIAAAEGTISNDGKASPDEPVTDKEPSGAKSEPMRPTPVDLSALQLLELDIELG